MNKLFSSKTFCIWIGVVLLLQSVAAQLLRNDDIHPRFYPQKFEIESASSSSSSSSESDESPESYEVETLKEYNLKTNMIGGSDGEKFIGPVNEPRTPAKKPINEKKRIVVEKVERKWRYFATPTELAEALNKLREVDVGAKVEDSKLNEKLNEKNVKVEAHVEIKNESVKKLEIEEKETKTIEVDEKNVPKIEELANKTIQNSEPEQFNEEQTVKSILEENMNESNPHNNHHNEHHHLMVVHPYESHYHILDEDDHEIASNNNKNSEISSSPKPDDKITLKLENKLDERLLSKSQIPSIGAQNISISNKTEIKNNSNKTNPEPDNSNIKNQNVDLLNSSQNEQLDEVKEYMPTFNIPVIKYLILHNTCWFSKENCEHSGCYVPFKDVGQLKCFKNDEYQGYSHDVIEGHHRGFHLGQEERGLQSGYHQQGSDVKGNYFEWF